MSEAAVDDVLGPTVPPAHVHDHAAYREKAATADRVLMTTLLLCMVGVTVLIHVWKTYKPRMYQFASTLALWGFPGIMGVYYSWWRFLVVWVAYTAATAYYVKMAKQKPMQATTPRTVYSYFHILFKGCYTSVAFAYAVFIIVVMTAQPPSGVSHQRTIGMVLTDYLMSAMLYSLYFAVLTRDVAELAAESISNALGYFKKDDEEEKQIPPHICAVCGEACADVDPTHAAGASMSIQHDMDDGDGRPDLDREMEEALTDVANGFIDLEDLETAKIMQAAAGNMGRGSQSLPLMAAGGLGLRGVSAVVDSMFARVIQRGKQPIRIARNKYGEVFKLPCKHSFHDICIRGWVMVGKKNSCPCCNEKVEMQLIAGTTIWGKSSTLFIQILSAVRYFVVWMPLILTIIRFSLYETGIDLAALQAEEAAHVESVLQDMMEAPMQPPLTLPPAA